MRVGLRVQRGWSFAGWNEMIRLGENLTAEAVRPWGGP
ncbi:MAG: hypothetical protein AVDCRST_MAG02-665 [uncultured Rubrobacteraceae bacterium]|uniref:Uncharacterized protein n=1 Tax=uncultured Rubrobacteraceae bacterium TaxID=349277 RepID=A0A6J4QLV5_9ACTN|nr:MAG: hypothetical protein AVDCRST_MAG02-665 [uncultured Rubrobacteraceae bacterium]